MMKTTDRMNEDSILRRSTNNPYFVPLLIIVGMFEVGQILTGGFASAKNISSILTFSCIIAIMTFSQILVIVSGGAGIDLSLGSVMSFSALITPSFIANDESRIPLTIMVVGVIGLITGFINASGILFMGIEPMIMTMIMAAVVDGIAMAITQGMPPGRIPELLLALGSKAFWNISWLLVITIVITVLMVFLLIKTKFGKSLLLIGSNRNAARISGLNIRLNVYLAYMFAGGLAAVGGVMLIGYSGSAILKMANGYNLFSVAAAVIGGTKMSGGEGSIIGGFLGAIIFTLLNNVLLAVGLPYGLRTLIQGMVLLVILGIYTRGPKMRQ